MSRVAVVVKGYPRLSETFIAQEILGLERLGVEQLIVSLRHPTDPHVHDMHREIQAEVLYLPEYLEDDPARVAAAERWAGAQPGHAAARAAFEADLARDASDGRHRRWGQACVMAHELPSDITWLHTHYLHTPASVTRYAALIRGMQWSFSAHAKDIWTSEEWELRDKLADAAWGVTCTRLNAEYLNGLADRPDKVELVYHGLDMTRFPPAPAQRPPRDGTADPVRIVSVGRAVEKKGYGVLLEALAALPPALNWRFSHIGGGELLDALKRQADALGLSSRIDWRGALARDTVIEAYADADLFVLPCTIAASGDRDGLPNVLMEAQTMGLACLSTRVSAIPELIDDGETGVLVAPDDSSELAQALARLIEDPALRARLGTRAAEHVRAKFSSQPGIARLAERFRPLVETAAA
ncbi:glycosyltransferase family 4 protein [Breoghania sp. L-A4]|uniref:glycosyltransferase family 4 protein n=1 Tax=Breoghania sp. L-A4 TaxID=2304600 RepID=UPI000E35AF7D|nr:glycosyltransferase family 4 protein [Breoghania sp. L-A4]AXS40010.1 colanic acid biosynthesis glycosyltransferase WcaL [Breoghania sp. L-A4]